MTQTTRPQALSAPTEYSFLMGVSGAESKQSFDTPLEEASAQIDSFALYNTGTKAHLKDLTVTPEVTACCEAIRAMQITLALKQLAVLVAALQNHSEATSAMPLVIVNPGVVAEYYDSAKEVEDYSEEMFREATFDIQYLDSTPMIQGIPVWDRLPGERADFFQIFKLYRDSRYYLLDNGDYMFVNRTMAGLARQLKLPGATLTYISNLYSWKTRCKLYDEYMELENQKRAAQRISLIQSDQMKIAKQLCDKAMNYLNTNFKNLAPKDVLNALELGLKISRINAGLLPDKPGNGSAVSGPKLAIYNTTTTNNADQMLNVQNIGGDPSGKSEVERQIQRDMKSNDTLLSVMHVLQASGALTAALNEDEGVSMEPIFETDEDSE